MTEQNKMLHQTTHDRFTAVMAGLLLCLGLGACQTTAQETTASVPSDYRQRHPIAISETDRTLQIFVGSKRGGLSAAQRADVMGFAASWKREATGGIVVDLPTGTSNAQSALESLREIQSLLVASGIPAHVVTTRTFTLSNPAAFATLKLNYPKLSATAGPCGLWPFDLGPVMERNYNENVPYWNSGCASQRNLAAMVENPADLVQPRAEAPANQARRSIVLDKYRKGEGTATNYPNPDKGKISDIGK